MVLVIAITLLAAASIAQSPQSPPSSRKPYDFRYRIEPRSDFDGYNRHPEKPAVRISGDEPRLTPEARKARISGIVILQIAIDIDGRPTHYLVLKPLPFGLAQAAVDAVRTWRFKPAMDRGRRVRVIQNVTVRFDPAK